jgi:hypothetical protein
MEARCWEMARNATAITENKNAESCESTLHKLASVYQGVLFRHPELTGALTELEIAKLRRLKDDYERQGGKGSAYVFENPLALPPGVDHIYPDGSYDEPIS